MRMSINRDFMLGMAMGAAAALYMVVKKFGNALNIIDEIDTVDEDGNSQE